MIGGDATTDGCAGYGFYRCADNIKTIGVEAEDIGCMIAIRREPYENVYKMPMPNDRRI